MAVLVYCNGSKSSDGGKACHRHMEPLLDVNSNDVLCGECGAVVENITSFTKQAMKGQGQILRASKSSGSITSIICPICKKSTDAVLDKEGNVICGNRACGAAVKHLSSTFLNMLKEKLKRPKSV